MPELEIARIMPVDADQAWDALVDFPSRPFHSDRYRRAGLPDGTDLAPGHRIELQLGRDRFTSVVIQCRPRQFLSHRADGPGLWVRYTYRLRSCNPSDPGYSTEDQGNGHLTITTEYGGWLGSLIARLRPGACRRYLVDEMDAIISTAESVVAEPVDED